MIEEVATCRRLRSKISPLSIEDIRRLGKGWKFHWSDLLSQFEVFKLVATEKPGEILGLLSIERHQDGFVRVHQLESSPANVGRDKKYRGIPGNLLASAARLSFDLGYEGFVQLEAKTRLISHYEEEYGFSRQGNSHVMILFPMASNKPIAIFAEEAS